MLQALYLLTIVCVILAALVDIKTRRIPNWITLPAMLIGTVLNWMNNGWTGFSHSLSGATVGFVLLFVAYWLGGMGAGDVKLLAAVGAFLGPRLVFYSFIWMALAGGVLALAFILYRRAVSQTFRNLTQLVMGWFMGVSGRESNLTIKNESLIRLPYGVAIAVGTILTVWFKDIPRFSF